MKMLSIDVGIKNMSFCLFDTNNLKIIKWDNINLSEKKESKCMEIDKKGLCDKPAKLTKDGNCYCLKHSKKHPYLKPFTISANFNKQKIQEIADKYKITYDKTQKKADILVTINEFIKNNCYSDILKLNATKVDLVTIGRNLQHKLDEILAEHLSTINIIIIENQIGPLANKMKTVQGMISQYFIMRNNDIHIEAISACNKLKDFLPEKEPEKEKEKMDYKQRKKLGVQICLEMVQKDIRFKEWETFFNKHNKKDDLSDSFLQGMWYIKHKT